MCSITKRNTKFIRISKTFDFNHNEGRMGTIIGGLIAGIIIGPLARLILPGKQNISLIMTIALGAVGAIAGGFIYQMFGGGDTSGIDWIKLALQVGVAAAAVVLYGNMRGRST
jgi:uncharacterized membrane protein YeaQ/YmgE (transglycosylase-associated protein family)